ncbi:hypothetical protein BaRGS_00011532, partial [Batillaria attramentaria]
VAPGGDCQNLSRQCVDDAVCNSDGKCECSDQFYSNGTGCVNRVAPGGDCQNLSRQCVDDAVCNSGGKCECSDQFYSNGTGCVNRILADVSCSPNPCQPNACNPCVSDAVCHSDGFCRCLDGYFVNNGRCEQRIALGSSCGPNPCRPTGCNPCISNAECQSGSCRCMSDYYESSGQCIRKKDYGAPCTSSRVCKAAFACDADDGKCLCPANTFRNDAQCSSTSTLVVTNLRRDGPHQEKQVNVVWTPPTSGGAANQQRRYRVTLDDSNNKTTTDNKANYTVDKQGTPYGVKVYTSVLRDPDHNTNRRVENTDPAEKTVYTKPAQPGALLPGPYPGPLVTLKFGSSDGRVEHYEATLSPGGEQHNVSAVAGASVQTVTFQNVVEGKSYNITIRARITDSGQYVFSKQRVQEFRVRPSNSGPVSSFTFGDTMYSRQVSVSWSMPDEPKGKMTGYIVAALDRDNMQCVSGVSWTCNGCVSNITQQVASLNCTTSRDEQATREEFQSSSHVFYTNLTGLLPYRLYIIRVFPYNEAGEGTRLETNTTTDQERADDFSALNVASPRVGELNVTWTPGIKTGPTTYSVTWEEETGLESSIFIEKGSDNVTGYENTAYTIMGGLLSYWNYKVSVTAFTVKGSSQTPPSPWIGRTKDSQPGEPVGLSISQPSDSAQRLVLTVACPVERERNGPIRAIGYNSTRLDTGKAGPRGEEATDCSRNITVITAEDVVAEKNYTFNVFAVTNNYNGNISSMPATVLARAPQLNHPPAYWPDIVKQAEAKAPTQTSITVDLCTCLVDDGQGEITFAALIVCRKSPEEDCGTSPTAEEVSTYKNLPTWKQFRDGDASRRRRSVSHRERRAVINETVIEYTIGNDTDCVTKDADVYCNGPLQSDSEYVIIVVSCTRGGCAEYSDLTGIRTRAPDPGTPNVGGIVGGVVGAVVAVAVVVVVIFFVRRWQNRPPGHTIIDEEQHIMKKPVRKPIKLRDFDAHIARLHKDANLLFQEEFEDIQENSPKHFTQDFALMDANKVKNRYVNILPFDHTRVKLNSDDDEEFSDFVNANYIPGYSSPREYIATQGPITCTIDDFWRMIWEQKSSIIVMLSDLAEKGRPKVDLYWPTEVNSPVQYGDIIVELTANSTLNKCTIRNFKILMVCSCWENQEERKVTQYFIPGWEDYGANLSPDDLLDFIKMVRQEARSTQGPITVHCSAGVGRTGTFIALDFLMQFVDDHDLDAEVDIYNLVLNMRHNRPHMVQSEKQYVFIHDALKLIIERKVRAMEEAENEGLYQNTGFQDNVYANQAFGQ